MPQSQKPACSIPLSTWGSSPFLLNNIFLQIMHLACFRPVMTICDKCLVIWRISMMLLLVRFVGEFDPQGYQCGSEQTQISRSLSKSHHTPPHVEGYHNLTWRSVYFTKQHHIHQILHNDSAHYLLTIVSGENAFCHPCNQLVILFIRCYYNWPSCIQCHSAILQSMYTLES
jgi:hypothetical protein